MKSYTITVNGNVYEVTVEEHTGTAPVSTPVFQPVPKAAPAPALPVNTAKAAAGSVPVKAGAAGKVYKIEAKAGDQVKAGDSIIIIEAMKMEIPLVAPQDGIVASIDCSIGDACDAGEVLATLK